jgi:HD-GYP domain-containing protein (c-di-GMP phosphodiesterase class II)
MRYVSINCLRPGQKLASDLRMNDKRIFVKRNVPLTEQLIERVRSLGFQGVYIEDDISKDLYIAGIISEGLQIKARDEVRSLFIDADSQKKPSSYIRKIDGVVSDMVEEILSNQNMMVNIVDIRTFDDYTFCHCLNVAMLSVVIGVVLRLTRKQLHDLALGALIHDIGKVFIDKSILNKPGKLDREEMNEIKNHSRKGYEYLKECCQMPEDAMLAVLTHHERYDGKGYPQGLKKEEIGLFGRIISVADVYDALVSDRPYRRAFLPSEAMEYIMSGYANAFDPKVVSAFIRRVAPFPIGTCVELSNGVRGIVVENYEALCSRPRVRVIADGGVTDEYIDLAHDSAMLNVTVQKVLEM